MNAQILSTIPISGKYCEIVFGSGNDLLWVLFTSDDNEEWVGKFELGMKSILKTAVYKDNLTCYVLAGGNLYLINLISRQLEFKFEDDAVEEFIYLPDLELLAVSNGLSISIFNVNNHKIEWKSTRISWDGILFDSYEDGIIKGRLNDLSEQGCNCPFQFNIYDKQIKVKYNVPPPS